MWANLKKKLITILQANTLFQEVYDYEVPEFGGDPVAVLIPSSNESDYKTTSENERVYAFQLQLWVKSGEPKATKQTEDTMTDLVDSVLHDFDKYFTLQQGSPGTLTVKTGYTMKKVQATPSTWLWANRGDTFYRVAFISLQVEMRVDIFNA